MRIVRSSDQLLQHTGEGDATVYTSPDMSYLFNSIQTRQHKEEQRKRDVAARDRDLEEKLKYNPSAIYAPYEKEHQAALQDLLKHKAYLIQNKIYDPSNPSRIAYEDKKNQLIQNVAKGQEIHKRFLDTRAMLSKDPFRDQEVVAKKSNDILHDENGNSRAPIKDVNPSKFDELWDDPGTLNLNAATQDFVKKIPAQAASYIQQQKTNLGEGFKEDIVKNKFFQYDDSGKLKTDPSGQPIIKITPETKYMFYQSHPLVEPRVKEELKKPENKGLTEDQYLQKLISPYAYEQRDKNITGFSKYSTGKKTEDPVQVSVLKDQEQNLNVNKEGGQTVLKGWVPEEQVLSGKKMEKAIPVISTEMIDQENNSPVKDAEGNPLVGSRPVTISRIQKLPVDSKGTIIHNSKEKIQELEKKGGIKYKWFANGTYAEQVDPNDKDSKVLKRVLIPYDQVESEMKAKYGFDLNPNGTGSKEDQKTGAVIKRKTKDGRIALFDEKTKNFLRYE